MVPVKVKSNVGDILTKFDFNLKYDTDMFKKAYIVCDDEKIKSKVDLEKGFVNVTYDRQDPELSNDKIKESVDENQIELYLALQVRDDTFLGDSVIEFKQNGGFQIESNNDCPVVVNQGLISAVPISEK